MQLLAPVAAMQTAASNDAFAVLCSHGQTGDTSPGHGDHGHQHHHCLLCQVGFSGPPLSERTPFAAPRRTIVRRLAWRPNAARAPPRAAPRQQQPRGPPILL